MEAKLTQPLNLSVRLSQHLDDDSLVGDGSAWRSPLERFAFYIKVLAGLQGNS